MANLTNVWVNEISPLALQEWNSKDHLKLDTARQTLVSCEKSSSRGFAFGVSMRAPTCGYMCMCKHVEVRGQCPE